MHIHLKYLILLALILTGCELADPSDCNAYGVYAGEPIGPVDNIIELPPTELQIACKQGHIGSKNRYVGCVRIEDGQINVYYETGNRCALNHELAHTHCGGMHTGKYFRDGKYC